MNIQARSEALRLSEQRKRIDQEIEAQWSVLTSRNVTLTSPLVDTEGFPIAGLDIAAVRTARHQIHVLTNDRLKIDAELKKLLECALAGNGAQRGSAGPTHTVPTPAPDAPPEPPVVATRPVAVRSVAPESPAAAAGLAAGDVVLAFADLDPLTSVRLGDLPPHVRDGAPVPVRVARVLPDGRKVDLALTLTPSSAWGGRGLLGYVPPPHSPSCHLVPA